MIDHGNAAAAKAALLQAAARQLYPQAPERAIAAEAVAACALLLINQWPAWQAVNAAALAAERDPAAGAALMREVAGLQQDPAGMLRALEAWELLDAAVRSWAPHAHPVGTAARAVRPDDGA